MSRYIAENIREFVALRAKHKCKYCFIHKYDLFFVYQIDHIISLKHKVLDLNNIDRVILRQGLMAIGRYP